MAGSMNKVIIIGRMGQDPKLSYTQSGQSVANFTLATDEGYKDKQSGQRVDKTEWHRIVVWGQQAEFCGNYLGKGRLVLVEGRLQTRKWQAQDGSDRWTTEVVAQRVQALDGRPQEGQQRPQQGQQQGGSQGSPYDGSQGGQQGPPDDEDMGPAFPSEASGMDDVPF